MTIRVRSPICLVKAKLYDHLAWKVFVLFTACAVLPLVLLIHCMLVDFSTVIYWTSLFLILEVSGLFCRFNSIFDGTSC